MYLRGVPRLCSKETVEYLTDQVGFFRELKINQQTGKPIMPKPPRKRRRKGRSRIIGSASDAEVFDEGLNPDTGDEQEV
jgi:hypothetical protein